MEISVTLFKNLEALIGNELKVKRPALDLSFALARFGTKAGMELLKVLFDHKEATFGIHYGYLT
ncbi:MAG: hypothetical protein ACP5JQ_07940 [Caldimicrobium sp.]